MQKQSPGMFYKKVFLKILKTSQENPCVEAFFNKVAVFKKATPTQVRSCEVCEAFKNTYFEEHLQTTASGGVQKSYS